MNVIVICCFSFFVLPEMPWWFISILASMAGFTSKGALTSIANGFLCGSIPWVSTLLYHYYTGSQLLIHRVSGIIGMENLSGALFATVLIGGVVGAMGALCSYTFKVAFKDQLIRE
jgi:hypothetical protein